MKTSEIIEDTENLVAVRPRKNPEKDKPLEYDVKEAMTGSKKGWVYLDAFTKSAMKRVWEEMTEAQRIIFDKMPLLKLIDFTWRVVGTGGKSNG